ncbi:hypothetical protein ACLB2K_039992 [Fragaria x ananassa]
MGVLLHVIQENCFDVGSVQTFARQVTNDIFTKEDDEFLVKPGAVLGERIHVVETGGCPHATICEDININLGPLKELSNMYNADTLLCESGGDNLVANFSRELANYIIYIIDVSGGNKIPRKGGPGITQADLLITNFFTLQTVSPVSGDPNLKVSQLLNQYDIRIPLFDIMGRKDGKYTVKSGAWLAMELKNKEADSPGSSGNDGTNCRHAKKTWKQSFLGFGYNSRKESSFISLFERIAKVAAHGELELFGVIVEESECLPHAQLRLDPLTSPNVNSSSSHPRVGPDKVKWSPTANFLKLNVDTSCVHKMGKKIEVEFDAANVIEALSNPDADLSMEGPVFDEIRILKREFEEVRWRKIPRCSNQVAHILEAAKFDGIKYGLLGSTVCS